MADEPRYEFFCGAVFDLDAIELPERPRAERSYLRLPAMVAMIFSLGVAMPASYLTRLLKSLL